MKLYLVQHGEAVSKDENPQRPLSKAGGVAAERMACFLKSRGVKPAYLWHSGKERALQTAQIFSRSFRGVTVMKRDDLNPLDAVDRFPKELIDLNKDVMIVGHLPFLQKLASLLLVGSDTGDLIVFRYGAVACFDYQLSWRLLWYVVPEMHGSFSS